MQDINTLTSRAVRSIESGPQPQSASDSAFFERVMDRLWERMAEIYGHRWTSAYGETPAQGWEIALRGISPERIKQGLELMAADRKYHDWPPAALEFRALCLPRGEDFGLPSADEAFAQAVGNRTEKHPSVVFTLRAMGDVAFELRRMPSDKARELWARWWPQTVEHVAAGGELPEPEPEIEHKPAKASADAAAPHRAALMEMFG